jgi:pimeloyl-ACP methyl ester carboxylesterase
MNPNELCFVEFAPIKQQAQRKLHISQGWCLEYAVFILNPYQNGDKKQAKRTLFAFHGFARPLEDMKELAEYWPIEGTLISVHLLHHGASGPSDNEKEDDSPIPPSTFNKLLVEIAQKEGLSAQQYDLIGYSIGGRIGLTLFNDAPDRWNHITLLAPDGLKQSPFYYLTVHTKLGQLIWFAIDRHAALVIRCNNALLKSGLIPSHLHGFFAFHIVNHEMRMMVWKGWRAHRLCWPTLQEITQSIKHWDGRMDIVFGDHDRIIPKSNGKRLQKMNRANKHVHFHSLHSGHGMLKPTAIQKLINRIFPT